MVQRIKNTGSCHYKVFSPLQPVRRGGREGFWKTLSMDVHCTIHCIIIITIKSYKSKKWNGIIFMNY